MSKHLHRTRLSLKLREVAEAIEEDRSTTGKMLLEDLAALDTADADLRQLVDQMRARLSSSSKESRDRTSRWKDVINLLLKYYLLDSAECKSFVSEFSDMLD